jgi:hypothetical protein
MVYNVEEEGRAFERPEAETERIRPKSHDLHMTVSECATTPLDIPPTMAELLTLWCYVKGHRTYFCVSISPDHDIYELKTRIYAECNNSLVGYNVKDLNLAKVRYITISM